MPAAAGNWGFLAGLRAFLGPAGLPVAVAALVLLTVGVGFLTLSFERERVQSIAANSAEQVVAPSIPNPAATDRVSIENESLPEPNSTTPAAIRVSQPVAASARKPLRKKAESRYANMPSERRRPVLSPVDDDADRTLRLTDLFDGVGGN